YNCAQMSRRQHKSAKTHGPGIKHRGKGQMDSFDCDGWLTIWACPDTPSVFLRIRHQVQHTPYCCIDVPDDVKEYIRS
ncbi:hypothetical protein CPB85DRAFT_1164946, partial [Mucidula mucida]